jgi:hypothetical protein
MIVRASKVPLREKMFTFETESTTDSLVVIFKER